MTAQEEANRIMEIYSALCFPTKAFQKSSALIAVDLIIEELEFNNGGNAMECKRVIFYKVVKSEIEKL